MPGESRSPRVAEIDVQAHRRGKHQPVTAGPNNTRDNQMAKGRRRNVANRNQGNMVPSEPISPTTSSPGYPTTPGKQDFDLKSQVMMLMEGFKKDINNSLKEIQENTSKQGEALEELKENSKTGEVIEQRHPGSKDGGRNNNEITKGNNLRHRKPRKEVRSHGSNHQQRIQEIEERISDAEIYHRKH